MAGLQKLQYNLASVWGQHGHKYAERKEESS